MAQVTVLYNGACPICGAEIAHYKARAVAHDLPLAFQDIAGADLGAWGLTREAALRRFHLRSPDGAILSGIPAFAVMWAMIPGFGWLARLVRLPVIGAVTRWAYDRLAAPLLYRMHKRRMRLGKTDQTA